MKGSEVMGKTIRWIAMVFVIAAGFLALSTGPSAWAKQEGTPAGWHRGKKTGWHGANKPPGLAKKKHHKHHGKHHPGEKEDEKKEGAEQGEKS